MYELAEVEKNHKGSPYVFADIKSTEKNKGDPYDYFSHAHPKPNPGYGPVFDRCFCPVLSSPYTTQPSVGVGGICDYEYP
jgi:hypothetical protein